MTRVTRGITGIIGKTLGYKSQQETAVYARIDAAPVKNSIQQVNNKMIDIANGENHASA